MGKKGMFFWLVEFKGIGFVLDKEKGKKGGIHWATGFVLAYMAGNVS